MKLLDAFFVRKEKDRTEEERVSRIENLKKAETDSVRRLNEALEREDAEKKRIANEQTARGGTLEVRGNMTQEQVDALEKRKALALEPASEVFAKANALLAENEAEKKEIDIRKENLAVKEQTLMDRAEKLSDDEDAFAERVQSLDTREVGIKASEDELKRSTSELSKNWLDYHVTISKNNEIQVAKEVELDQRKKENDDAASANASFKESLDKREQDLEVEKKQLADQRETLQRGFQELEAKKQSNG